MPSRADPAEAGRGRHCHALRLCICTHLPRTLAQCVHARSTLTAASDVVSTTAGDEDSWVTGLLSRFMSSMGRGFTSVEVSGTQSRIPYHCTPPPQMIHHDRLSARPIGMCFISASSRNHDNLKISEKNHKQRSIWSSSINDHHGEQYSRCKFPKHRKGRILRRVSIWYTKKTKPRKT